MGRSSVSIRDTILLRLCVLDEKRTRVPPYEYEHSDLASLAYPGACPASPAINCQPSARDELSFYIARS